MNKLIGTFYPLIVLVCISIISLQVRSITINTNALFSASLTPQKIIPQFYQKHHVNTVKQALKALVRIHQQGGFGAVIFSPGTYQFSKTIQISAPNIMLVSQQADPFSTVLRGNGMKATKGVDNLFRVTADNFLIDGLTLEQAGNHLVQVAGENGANHPVIRNSILQNGYEQLVKVTYSRKPNGTYSSNGLIENCLFQYTAGIGPNFYIGGIDAHGIQNWQIKNNIFVNIASPSKHIAEHAIHLWNDTKNNLIEDNIIINSDRGIGLGMRNSKANIKRFSNSGGIIQGNVIYHANNHHPFADTGIILEDSPDTIVRANLIYFEHKYPNAIEFRFEKTTDVLIIKNETNRSIMRRNNAEAIILNNTISGDIKTKVKALLEVKM